jgi:hypothetical protein
MKQPCVCDLKMGGNSKGAFEAFFVVSPWAPRAMIA